MIISKNISLKEYTTIKIGGKAKKIYFPENISDINNLADISKKPKTDSNTDTVKVIYKKHKIKRGESLWSIAIKYGSTITAICEVNKLNRNKPIRIGKTITVPIGQYKSQPKKIYYTIKRGDTLSGIAVKNKTSVSKIKKWNNIKDANKIKPGQKLVIYK